MRIHFVPSFRAMVTIPGVTVEQNGQAIMGAFGGSGGLYSAATTGPVARRPWAAWCEMWDMLGPWSPPPNIDDSWSQPSILLGIFDPCVAGYDEHIEYGHPLLNHQRFVFLLQPKAVGFPEPQRSTLASEAAVPGVIKIKAGFEVRAGSQCCVFPDSPH